MTNFPLVQNRRQSMQVFACLLVFDDVTVTFLKCVAKWKRGRVSVVESQAFTLGTKGGILSCKNQNSKICCGFLADRETLIPIKMKGSAPNKKNHQKSTKNPSSKQYQ